MALLIKADGTQTNVSPAKGDKFTLKELQTLAARSSGMVEHLNLTGMGLLTQGGFTSMWLDEEGKFDSSLQRNEQATNIAWKYAGIAPDDFIVGDVLLTHDKEVE